MAARFPELTKNDLVDLGGWEVLKEARALAENGAVRGLEWAEPVLRGEVGLGGRRFFPRLNLRNQKFAENKCSCFSGREGVVCAHAVALCLAASRENARVRHEAEDRVAAEAAAAEAEAAKAPPTLQSLQVATGNGREFSLTVTLPPNLEKTAPRDAIMVKLDAVVDGERIPPEKLNRGLAYRMGEAELRATALVEEWCGGKVRSLLQLKRVQLAALLALLAEQPAFFWANKPKSPIVWTDGKLPGVHELVVTESTAPAKIAFPPVPDTPTSETVPAPLPPPHTALKAPRVKEASDKSQKIAGKPSVPALRVDGSSSFLSVSLGSREHPRYADAVELLKDQGFTLEPSNRKWWLRDRHKTLNFLARYQQELEEEFGATFTRNFRDRTRSISAAEVQAEARELSGGYEVELAISAGGADENDIRQALASGRNYLEHGKKVILLDPEKLERVLASQRALAGDPLAPLAPRFRQRISAASLRDTEDLVEPVAGELVTPETWKARSGALKSVAHLRPAPLPQALDDQLRTYQRIGAAWLWHLYQNRLGGILADEMGLGKTAQALALLSAAKASGERTEHGPFVVVCPASLTENWRREAARFSPELKTFVHHQGERLTTEADFEPFDLVITSYGTLVRDQELFDRMRFAVVIADEAQHIKNRKTQNARALRALQARGRFLLTGTPVENSLDDLRSLFAFILPGYLAPIPSATRGDERAWFDQRHLDQAGPYILRRTKEVVAPELPEKIEQVVFCEFGKRQSRLYRETHERTRKEIFEMEMAGASENRVRFAALNQLLRLRQVCAEPRLLDDSLPPEDSAKLEAFLEVLDEALDGGRRMLVFSQFVSVLKHLSAALEERDLPYCYLDGQTKNRQAVCDRFNGDAEIPVFLISLKAGGTGLNLTGADMVVHFDPWWNPAVEAQATDRAHRIGQTRMVTSLKLIAAGTVEEKVLELQRTKAALLRDLLDVSTAANAKVGLAEIKALLETG